MPTGFEVDEVWSARNRGFQMGVIQPDGVVIHLTGQVAWDTDERIVGKGDVAEQTRQCFRNIKVLLAKVGGRLDDILAITTYFLDRVHLPAIQRVRTEVLLPGSEPASTSVIVVGLGHADFLVELTAIVVIPKTRFIPAV